MTPRNHCIKKYLAAIIHYLRAWSIGQYYDYYLFACDLWC